MNERAAKIVVVVIGLLATLAVVAWRSAAALKEETAGGAAPEPGYSMTVVSESAVLAGSQERSTPYVSRRDI